MDLRSGIWRGFYEQFRSRYPQAMRLEFADGLMRGSGDDDVGPFSIDGEFRIVDGETRLGWVKTYDGGHSVLYLGVLRDGVIVGSWDIHGHGDGFALEYAPEHGD